MCRLSLAPDGSVTSETLVARPEGCVRDPALSPDARTLLFSMRDSYNSNDAYRVGPGSQRRVPWRFQVEERNGDDYHLYSMDMVTRKIRKLTFSPVLEGAAAERFWMLTPGSTLLTSNAIPERLRERIDLPAADYEPCFLSDGGICFASTRCEAVIPCHKPLVANLFRCDHDGGNIRRLTFDGASDVNPQPLEDGRILYMRYEYNDRNARFQQPLFTMNPDGTAQTEYYGNNSYYPVSLHHFRQIPGSPKLLGIIGGHHSAQKGKLIRLDRRKGTQGDSGITFVAGSSPDEEPGCVASHYANDPRLTRGHENNCDEFAQFGPQWQYPFPISEDEWVTGFLPEGTLLGRWGTNPNFGIYWQNAEGARELLAYDPAIECGQPVPVISRKAPAARCSLIDADQSFGKYYVRDVYIGPGLAGVPRGTVKTLRVCAIESRPMFLYTGAMWSPSEPEFRKFIRYAGDVSGEAITLGGAWDIKHVLGEVDVAPDGSCAFEAPANNALYFQLLDVRGCCVQTMRSWTQLAPGEIASCVGCHEDKMQVYPAAQEFSRTPVQRIRPAPGLPAHPLLSRLRTEGLGANGANRLGVNAPRSSDPEAPTEGFSFRARVQPILDRHCVKCHDGKASNKNRPRRT